MALFLTIPDIPGEAKDKDHPDAIDLLDFSWGLTNVSTAQIRKTGRPSFADLRVRKELDRSTPKLALAAATGRRLSEVVLDQTASFTDSGRVTFLSIKLWNAVVTEVSEETEGPEQPPGDVIAFEFPKVEMVYTLYDSKGKKAGTERFAWDLVKGETF